LLTSKGYTTPATDWTQLFDQAKKLTQKQGNTYTTLGLSMGAYENNEFWFDTFNLLLLQSKVQMVSENRLEATFASDAAAAEAATYFNSYEKNSLWNSSFKKDIALFLEKKLAMYIAPTWRLNDIIFYNNTYNLGMNYGIAPMPQLSSLESESVGWSNYWAQTVAADSSNSAVAWDFLNFASQPEQLRLLFTKAKETRAFGQIYPRPDMKSDLAEDANLKVYVDEVAQSKSWYMVDGNAVKSSMQKWLNGTQTPDATQTSVTTIITNTGFLKPQ